jgi:hypothetical protein
MDEDQILQSIIADPELTDPSIDVSRLRQTTPTRAELLANVPEFSGLKYDPTSRKYFEDLYTLYGGGLPMVPVEDKAQIPGAIDTLVDVGGDGGGSAMDQPAGDSILDTTPTDTFAGQPVGSITPGTTIDNVTGDITNPDGSFGGNIVDEVALTGAAPGGVTGDPIDVGIPDIESGFVDPLGTIPGPPMVGDFQEPTVIEGALIPGDIPGVNPVDEVALTGGEPTITAEDTPEKFIDKVENFLGVSVNIPKFIISSAINLAIGKPVTLAFDIAKDLFEKSKEEGVTSDDAFDVTNEAAFAGFDAGGFDPATPVDTPDLTDDFEVSGDVANVGTTMDLIGPAPVDNIFDEVALTGGGGDSDPAPTGGGSDFGGFDSGGFDPAPAPTTPSAPPSMGFGNQPSDGGGGGGSPKIVCTMMNESYGFGSFRNKIWLRHSKGLAPEYQKGYHKIFLPLVKLSKKNIILKKILEHIAVHRTIDIRQESRGKVHLLGRVYRKILEPICYWVGKYD